MYAGSVALLVIIVVAFVGGPLVGRIGANQPMVFGTYDGEEILYAPGNYLARQTEVLYDQLQDSSAQSYEYQAYQVWKGAYDRTVVRTAMLQAAEKAGLYVSDNQVDEILLTTGPYMENGAFSETRYNSTPNSERFKYRSLYREEYTQQLYLQDVLHYGLYSSKEADFLKEMASEERAFNYALIGYDDFPSDQVSAYADVNAAQFRKIKVSRITMKSSREDTEIVRQQIVDGTATFEDQARNFSSDAFAEEGGDMGWMEYSALAADFSSNAELEALFLLQKDQISGVFDTSFGWVIYRADEAATDPDLEDPDTLDSIRSYMERFERGRIEDYLLASAEGYVTTAALLSFQEAADEYGVDVKKTDSFPINFGNVYYFSPVQSSDGSSELGSAAYDETLLTMLFNLKEGDISEPIVLSDGVGVFQLADQTTLPEEEVEFLGDYYPFIAQQNIEQDLNSHILASDAFEDNFTEVFTEFFLNP
jgi:parvulin-like peptidyl-prolyl isomerase